jgi:Domain of unknown function (DUF1707)
MAVPGDELAASAGRGHLRASHADREQVIDTLKAAFVQGRLTKNEFDQRVSQAFTSRTYAGLATLTADLPVGPMSAGQPREPVPAQDAPPVNKPLMWGACAVIVAAIGSLAVAIPADNVLLLAVTVLAILMAAPVAGTLLLDSWREQSSGGQAPPGPARPGQALEGEQDGGIRNDPTLFETRWQVSARPVPVKRAVQRTGQSLTVRREQRVVLAYRFLGTARSL